MNVQNLIPAVLTTLAMIVPAPARAQPRVAPVDAPAIVEPSRGQLPAGQGWCGTLEYDGVNGMKAVRRTHDGLEAWVLVNCQPIIGTVGGFDWLEIDNTEGDWNGFMDWALWDVDTAENGCADDSNVLWSEWDLPGTRDPLLDDNGNQAVLFNRLVWIYHLAVEPQSAPVEAYLGMRIVVDAGGAFILTRPCNGDKPIWFQSGAYGFPCAVPSEAIFGTDYCAAVVVLPGGPAEPQACCLEDGSCDDLRPETCFALGGVPQGAGTTCDTTTCPTQACCFFDGTCDDLREDACLTQGGVPQGPDTTCDTTTCPTQGCCFLDGSCDDLVPDACKARGGKPAGDGTSCDTTACPQPEACCFDGGSCSDLPANECAARGGVAHGDGTTCETDACLEACCFPDERCAMIEPAACIAQGGQPDGLDTDCPSTSCAPCEPRWDGAFPDTGADADVFAMVTFDDGTGPALYAGGAFTTMDGVEANFVARWDGQTWSALGDGLDGAVKTLAVFDDGSGPSLVAGGEFTMAGGQPASHVARWDGSRWSPLGDGTDDDVLATTVARVGQQSAALYVGGTFTTAGTTPARRVARWDGQSWTALGSGADDTVRALTAFDDGSGEALVAGGDFLTAGGVGTRFVARWNGSAWSVLGSGLDNTVFTLTAWQDALYAGGAFTRAGDRSAPYVARWRNGAWEPVDNGPNDWVLTLTVFDDRRGDALYAGGWFTRAGSRSAKHVARWDQQDWTALGTGLDGVGSALAVFDDGTAGGANLYIGGGFSQAGGRDAGHIARWGCPWLFCDDVSSLTTTCKQKSNGFRVKAVARTNLAKGTSLVLTLDDTDPREAVVKRNGKARVKWRRLPDGAHTICIRGCTICATVDCGS